LTQDRLFRAAAGLRSFSDWNHSKVDTSDAFVKTKLERRHLASHNHTHSAEVGAFALVGVEEFGIAFPFDPG
jgi:hypothetical protein